MNTSEDISRQIRSHQWELETRIPAELANTTNARRVASLKRQEVETQRELSKLVTELGATIQEEKGR